MYAVESAIDDLNKLQKELLDRVDSYRQERVTAYEESSPRQALTNPQINTGLADLQTNVEELRRTTAFRSVEDIRDEADRIIDQINFTEKKMRESIFGGKFMRFIQNELFSLNKELVGKLKIFEHDVVRTSSKSVFS